MAFLPGKGKSLKLKINIEQYETIPSENSESAGLLVYNIHFIFETG